MELLILGLCGLIVFTSQTEVGLKRKPAIIVSSASIFLCGAILKLLTFTLPIYCILFPVIVTVYIIHELHQIADQSSSFVLVSVIDVYLDLLYFMEVILSFCGLLYDTTFQLLYFLRQRVSSENPFSRQMEHPSRPYSFQQVSVEPSAPEADKSNVT